MIFLFLIFFVIYFNEEISDFFSVLTERLKK